MTRRPSHPISQHSRFAVVLIAASSLAVACSDPTSKSCPPCGAGMICDQASGTCVLASNQCPASCGNNATCNASKRCACTGGFADCNGDLGQTGGNGCECDKGCSGGQCGATGCQTATSGSCGGDTSYCDGTACKACAPGTYNCDGMGPCESSTPCGGGTCQPSKAGACGVESSFCDNGTCKLCGANAFNCDGIDGCECSQPCQAGKCPSAGGCVKACTDFFDYLCVKDPTDRNVCKSCLENKHCKNNPRADGPTCNQAFKLCVCATNADCKNATTGKACRQVGKVKQCSCNTKSDCPAPYTICEGVVIKRCVKPCTDNTGCKRGGVQGTCDKSTGTCTYPEI